MYLLKNNVIYSSSQKEYFKYDLTNEQNIQIGLEEFCELLFGHYSYKLRNLLGYTNSFGKDKIYSSFYQSDDFWIHDKEGNLIERKKGYWKGYTPYEIQVIEERDEAWAATGSGQIVICNELNSGKRKGLIGTPYEDSSALSFPESVCAYEQSLYITEMGNKKITCVHLETGEMNDYLNFEEIVWDFQKNESAEIVLLDSGMYVLKDGKQIKI